MKKIKKDINPLPHVKKIAIVHSHVERKFFPTEEQYITEKDALKDAQAVADQINLLGINTVLIPGNHTMVTRLTEYKPDMVFNLVDSVRGQEYLSSTIPGMLDMMGLSFTGSDLLGLALCYNKFLTKQLLQSAGIPVPNFQLFHQSTDVIQMNLRYPLISKLNEIHGAVEINDSAISENEKQLRERLAFLIKTYNQPVLVEEFITGKEITAYVLQGTNTKIYLAEKVFHKPDKKYLFASFDDQWGKSSEANDPFHYEKYEDTLLKDYVRKAADITNMYDYAKFDIRVDASGRYYFIDSNANPAFGPVELDTAMGLIIQRLYGIPFTEILIRLINNTIGNGNDTQS